MAISPKELIEMKMLSKVDGYIERVDEYLKTHEPLNEWFEATIQSELPVVVRFTVVHDVGAVALFVLQAYFIFPPEANP